MGEAAYNEAKREGSLIEQRLDKIADHWATLGFEATLIREAADSLRWYERERDSLIGIVADRDRIIADLRQQLGRATHMPVAGA